MRKLPLILALAWAGACSDKIEGLKPPSADSDLIEVVTTLAKTVLVPGDTMRFTYSIENISGASLTLNTPTGCQVRPELDQVGGKAMSPPPLAPGDVFCPVTPTQLVLATGQKVTYSMLLRGYDSSKPGNQQGTGYLLTKGWFDAAVLVTATELSGSVRSDWVRFEVK